MSKSVIIFGSHSGRNKGDVAILLSMVENLKKLKKDLKIYIPSKNPKLLRKYIVEDEFVKIFKTATGYVGIKTLYYLMKSDLILVGGGGLFFSRKLFNPFYSHTVNLFFLNLLNKIIYRKPSVLFSVGASHLTTKISKFMVKSIIQGSSKLIVRDNSTRELFSKLTNKKISLYYDPALLLHPKNFNSDKLIYKSKNKRILVAINKSLFSSDYYSNFVKNIQVLSNNLDVYLYQNDEEENLINKLKEDCARKNIYSVQSKYLDPKEIIYFFSKFDYCLALPMHVSIFSFIAGTKSIPVIYDEKVIDFCKITKNVNFIHSNEYDKIDQKIKSYFSKESNLKEIRAKAFQAFIDLKEQFLNDKFKK